MVQELRGLEVEREALLFQVDVLQDTLDGVEELLAEAQREAGQANLVRQSHINTLMLYLKGERADFSSDLLCYLFNNIVLV